MKQVVLIGTSAGAVGTEYNCDYLADELQKVCHCIIYNFSSKLDSQVNPNIDVKCVSDSGTIHPPNTYSQYCRAEVLEDTFYTAWSGQPDQSCLDQSDDRLKCLR